MPRAEGRKTSPRATIRFALVKSCARWMQFLNRECTRIDANSSPFACIRSFCRAPFWCRLCQVRISALAVTFATAFSKGRFLQSPIGSSLTKEGDRWRWSAGSAQCPHDIASGATGEPSRQECGAVAAAYWERKPRRDGPGATSCRIRTIL